MGIIYSKCYNGVIMVPGFADDRAGCKQPECPCTDKTDLESSLAWTFLPLARPHCDLAGLFNGNLLFIELSLELYYQSWYIGAIVGVAACHDVDQGSSPHAVNC